MVKQTTKIVNKLGLHARPAAMVVTTASRFASEVYITKDDLRVNGKSIMGVMMLAAEMGSDLTIEANGEDENQALAEILKVIASGFGENG
ncbi:MAG: HPr family phosphocarrier protein [Candidatus Zixiibacteriota bacterium]